MVPEQQIFSVRQAAAYLKITVATIRYHLYNSGNLKPDGKVGNSLFFKKETLDRFKNRRNKKARPD